MNSVKIDFRVFCFSCGCFYGTLFHTDFFNCFLSLTLLYVHLYSIDVKTDMTLWTIKYITQAPVLSYEHYLLIVVYSMDAVITVIISHFMFKTNETKMNRRYFAKVRTLCCIEFGCECTQSLQFFSVLFNIYVIFTYTNHVFLLKKNSGGSN